MNVLCDRHHGGLYRSMQLLAKRMGWTLWTPIGREWQTEGYWRFGKNQPGLNEALAGQFLDAHDGVWSILGGLGGFPRGTYVSYDPEFPAEPIMGVDLARARLMDWAYVLCTLDDNQWGFRRFADEVGARYVLQVGNTNQYVDWSLDPLAIVTSEVPIVGRGVLVHQEMEPVATRWHDPRGCDPYLVSSFVNCYGRSECGWTMPDLQALLPTHQFDVHGIDGEVLKPIYVLASKMAASGWAFHDKVQGDGFGHVIHGWAAIGRPLIGHAHHYRGKMAEPFWVDGVTCIDLDVRSISEAADLIAAISADPDRHAEMCYAIRKVYDANVDDDADERSIRGLLEPVAVAA